MAKKIRQFVRALLYALPLVVVGVLLVWPQPPSEAATYTNPFWTNTSPSPECACANCPCEGPPEWSPEGVNLRTREFVWDHFLFRIPGMVTDHTFSIRWRSTIDGETDMGQRMLSDWLVTAEKDILDEQNPNGDGGHQVLIRQWSGRIDIYGWDGTDYSAESCNVHDVLTTDVSGNYVLTDPWNNYWLFDSAGMPDKHVDRNGNELDYTCSDYKVSEIEDDRGGTISFIHNQDGFVESIEDPAEREWSFTYTTGGELETITTPATADQQSGIVITLDYDISGRLISVEDGRENVFLEVDYDTSSDLVDAVTLDGDDVTFDSYGGYIVRTDRLDVEQYIYSTGANVTKNCLKIDSQEEYIDLYRFNGNTLINRVYPRGNRVDFTRDNDDNLTEMRYRTADTDTNDSSDLVHTWTYGSPTPEDYTDPEGNEWNYTYDGDYNRTAVTHPTVTDPATQTASTSTSYNNYGQVLNHTNEEGLPTSYVYYDTGASVGLLQRIEVGPGSETLDTSFTYDDAGNIATKTDPEGNVWTYTWDNLRRLTQVQAPSPSSHKIKYEYDANGNMTKKEVENRDKDGDLVTANPWFTTTYTYTNLNQVSTITEEIDSSDTRTTSIYYDDEGRRTRVVKPEGNEDRWTYDERGLVLTHVRGYDSIEASTTSYEYDDNGNLVTATDGRDHDTDHTFDLFDRRTKTTNELGHYTEWVYDENGHVTEVRRKNASDTLLQRSTRYYDERGRLWKTSDLRKDPSQTYSDAVTTFARLKTGQVETVTNARSKTTTYEFDTWLRVDTVTDALGNETSFTRDDNGNVTEWSIEETDGTSTVTHEYEATFDELDRRLTMVEIDRTDSNNEYTTTFDYDSRSNLVWQVNAEGNPTRWTFDGLGRMTKRERALAWSPTIEDFTSAQVTEWGFDENDRLTSHEDDGTNESTWAYDDLDRPTTMTYPDSNTVAYVYDDADNVTQVTDPAGNVIADTFDALNRNTSRSITLATGFVGTTSETRTFDGLDRMLTTSDNDYKVTFTYGVIGLSSQVYTEKQEFTTGSAYAHTVTKKYDAVGNKTSETYPSTMSLTYAYNDINALSSISDGTNTIASYTYWGSRLKGATFENGTTQSNSYGGFRPDLTSVHHQTSTPTTVVRLDYGYNKVHDRTYERFGGSGSSGDGFAYDAIRRLTNAWMGSVTPSTPSAAQYVKKIDYNYDDDGNRTSVVTTLWQQAPGTTSYSTNSLYQYTSVGGTTHVWDTNGNLTDNGTLLFEYNYMNLPVYVKLKSTSTTIATYRYDALGRRIQKDLGVTNKERYVYSGFETIATYNYLNAWQQDFVYAQGIDRIVMLEQADVLDFDSDQNTAEVTRSYYHRNALGSVMEITDMNQAAVVSYRYDPYGAVTITRGGQTQSTDPLGQHWTFTGRFCDEESGLYYYRARYYDSALGRFAQRDPAGLSEGPNLYHYVSSNPLTYSDPLGLREAIGSGMGGGPIDVDPDDPTVLHEVKHVMERQRVRRLCAPRYHGGTCMCKITTYTDIQYGIWGIWRTQQRSERELVYKLGTCYTPSYCKQRCTQAALAGAASLRDVGWQDGTSRVVETKVVEAWCEKD